MSKQQTQQQTQQQAQHGYVFQKQNYMMLLAGIAFIVTGLLLMIGGGSPDPKVFSEEIFNTQRLTVAPLCILAGFTVILFAIMKKPK